MRKQPDLKCSVIIQNLLKKFGVGGQGRCNFIVSEVFFQTFQGRFLSWRTEDTDWSPSTMVQCHSLQVVSLTLGPCFTRNFFLLLFILEFSHKHYFHSELKKTPISENSNFWMKLNSCFLVLPIYYAGFCSCSFTVFFTSCCWAKCWRTWFHI